MTEYYSILTANKTQLFCLSADIRIMSSFDMAHASVEKGTRRHHYFGATLVSLWAKILATCLAILSAISFEKYAPIL